MLIEEIINEWFGYKGIVSDVMDEYKLKIKEITLFKENFIFWNIFLFFLLLLSYQLKFSFFKNIYEFVSKYFIRFFLILNLIVLLISFCINNKNFKNIKENLNKGFKNNIKYILKNLKNKILHYIVLIVVIIFIYSFFKSKLPLLASLFVFLYFIIPVAGFEYYNSKNFQIIVLWIFITLIIIGCFYLPVINWEIPIIFILFGILYRKYQKYKKTKKTNETSDKVNTEIKKYKLITFNYICEDFCKNNKKIYMILKITGHIYFCWMYFQLINYLFKLFSILKKNGKDYTEINYPKITGFIILYLIFLIFLNKFFSKIKNKSNIVYILFCIITIGWYYWIIRKNVQRLLFFIFLNILIFIVYFFISFIKSSTRKEVLKKNMQVRENVLMNIINNFENNNDNEYKIEILKSLSLEVNKKIVFLRVVKWGFIIYILFQIISRYLYKYFTFETLSLFEELIKKFFSIQFSPEKIFNESIIFLLFVMGMFIVSQIIEKLLPYKLMELIYLNETINNLLLKEQKKGLKNVKKI